MMLRAFAHVRLHQAAPLIGPVLAAALLVLGAPAYGQGLFGDVVRAVQSQAQRQAHAPAPTDTPPPASEAPPSYPAPSSRAPAVSIQHSDRPSPSGSVSDKTDTRYLSDAVQYVANGEMSWSKSLDSSPFATAADCDRFTDAKLANLVRQLGGRVLGSSIWAPPDASGYLWFGCVHPSDVGTNAFTKYIDIRMTPEKAKAMERFPSLSSTSVPQQNSRGSKTSF